MYIIENFDPNAEETRKKALKSNYTSVTTQNTTYHGICQTKFEPYKKIIEQNLGFEITPHVSFFRYYTSTLRSPNFIHSDLNFCDYIGIQFLHKCNKGGFATWSHKKTGLSTANVNMDPKLLELFKNDSQEESNWRLEVLVNSKFNRLVIYNASGFHSHYPKTLWGNGPEDGRLVQVFFFNKK